MDKKQTISLVLVSLCIIGAWIGFQTWANKRWPKAAETAATQPSATQLSDTQPAGTEPFGSSSTQPADTQPSGSLASGAGGATQPAYNLSGGGLYPAPQDIQKIQGVELGSSALNDPNYAMQLRLSPYGAAIDELTLNAFKRGVDFKQPESKRRLYVSQEPYDDLPFARSMSTRSVTIDGVVVDVANSPWSLVESGTKDRPVSDGQSQQPVSVACQYAKFSTTVRKGSSDVLELTRTFYVFPKSAPNLGYEVGIDYDLRNLTDKPLTVSSNLNGPVLPPRESARPPDRQVLAGYRTADLRVNFPTPHAVQSFSKKAPTVDLTKDKDGNPVVWAGTSSVYFNAFVLFDQPDELAKVAAECKDIESQHTEDRPVLVTFETKPAALQAGQSHTFAMSAFFGPRWRTVLDSPLYRAAPRDYLQTLVVKSGPCGQCAFDWLILGLVALLQAFHYVAGGFPPFHAGDWGIAIILLVALVRTCLHPITKRSQVHMMRMGKMGPAMQELKKKYGDDKEAYSKAQMELMKEQGIAPLLGCLPMFLQMPIWIALWQALQSTFELRQAPFLWGFTWIKDLSKPDYLIKFDFDVPLFFGVHIDGINLLPLLMSVIFNVQARIQNKLQPAATPEQESQKKMMLWMSTLLFPLFLYNGPSGLNLYILTSTLVGIIESKVIRDHIKQKEAAEKAAGPVVVDARPTRGARMSRRDAADEKAKPSKFGGFIQRMQERIEAVQKEQDRQKRKNR